MTTAAFFFNWITLIFIHDCIILWLFKDHFARQFPIGQFGTTLSHLVPNSLNGKLKLWTHVFFFFSWTEQCLYHQSHGQGQAGPQQQCLQCFYLAVRHMAGAGWPSESDRYGKASACSWVIRLHLLGRLITRARRLWSLYSQRYYHLGATHGSVVRYWPQNSGWAHDTGKSVKKVFRLQQI